MKFVGITGGVGAGKSTILNRLKSKYKCKIFLADEIAHLLMSPGQKCHEMLLEEFGEEAIWDEEKNIIKDKAAVFIFSDREKRVSFNKIVHPKVKEYILNEVEKEREKKELDYVFFEAALLIEDGYKELTDELWYIFTTEANRRERLKKSRGYSDEKISSIFLSQLTEQDFRENCDRVIDNNGEEPFFEDGEKL